MRCMRFWFARNSGVPLREQLVTQVVLGILCDDLAPGERLPSTREIARRFRLHPNTVSAAYKQLEGGRWIEFRHGSGVFIRKMRPDSPPPELALDRMIASLFRSARELGVSFFEMQARLRQWIGVHPPDHFLLIEPDEDLRRIVVGEMRRVVSLPVEEAGLAASKSAKKLESAILVALADQRQAVEKSLPEACDLVVLPFASIPRSLGKWLPAPPDALIGVVSGWPRFLKFARTMLLAAGFHSDSIAFRRAGEPGWRRGLNQLSAVICDSLTASDLPKGCRAIPFPLLSESATAELLRYESFIKGPHARPL